MKLITRATAVLATAALALAASLSPAHAVSYAGHTFASQHICITNVTGSASWGEAIYYTANSAESGTATVITGYRTGETGCNDYPAWQRIRVYLYSANDGRCAKSTGTRSAGVWTSADGGPKVWLNQYDPACGNNPYNRWYNVGHQLAWLFGIAETWTCQAGDSIGSAACRVPEFTPNDRNFLDGWY